MPRTMSLTQRADDLLGRTSQLLRDVPDLAGRQAPGRGADADRSRDGQARKGHRHTAAGELILLVIDPVALLAHRLQRSEERRVGKEWRARWCPWRGG